MYFGSADGESAMSMLDDMADLFEQAAAQGTPIRDIVGDDPVEFVDMFIQNYDRGGYVTRERDRLTKAIDEASGDRP